MSHLTASPDGLAALFASRDGKVKLLHQFHHDLCTPLSPNSTDEMWGLAGTGSRAAPVLIPGTAFQAMEGLAPTFMALYDIRNAETLAAAAVPTGAVTCQNEAQNFKGKKCIAVPPFLTKAIMDANSENLIVLLQAVCQVTNVLDESTAAGERGPAEETKEEGGNLAENDRSKKTFFRIPQFLFLVAKRSLTRLYLECVTTTGATKWATRLHFTCQVGGATPAAAAPPGTTGGVGGRRLTPQPPFNLGTT